MQFWQAAQDSGEPLYKWLDECPMLMLMLMLTRLLS